MDWRPIEDFPGYSVSNLGRVRNDDTGRIFAIQRNQHGITHVGLVRDGIQYKRSVALLVCQTWMEDRLEYFDTPIHLDGDQSNNSIDNLMWRPRWFAVKYQRQFNEPHPSVDRQIQEIHTGYRFKDSWEAATTFGLLDYEIWLAIGQRTYVWPTYQEFRVVHQD